MISTQFLNFSITLKYDTTLNKQEDSIFTRKSHEYF